jgi:hypothetical protein
VVHDILAVRLTVFRLMHAAEVGFVTEAYDAIFVQLLTILFDDPSLEMISEESSID